MQNQKISVAFEIKTLAESGEFFGITSPWGVKDLGNDVVDRGSFTKTIAERGNKVPLLNGHEMRIGVAVVRETDSGLEMNGRINLDKQIGRDVYSDLKFYRDNGLPLGLSIGYTTIKSVPPDKSPDGARHLTEVALWEISVTETPMAETARVSSVKHAREQSSQIVSIITKITAMVRENTRPLARRA